MSQIIRLFPSRLNLNGDQANALVLQKRAEWSGTSIDVLDYEDASTLAPLIQRLESSDAPALLILGHGSLAAMDSIAHLKDQIEHLLVVCKNNHTSALIIGSSAEWLLEHTTGERVSEFWGGSIGYEGIETEVVGYLNSDANLDPMWIDGSLIYTLLHGPVMAKSPALADYLVTKLTGREADLENGDEISSYEAEAIKTALG
jgi:CobQ-like glutamine amidotransferase family enzyme